MLKTLRQCVTEFQSTPSVGRATMYGLTERTKSSISIHALRGEGDDTVKITGSKYATISIHALRGEGDFLNTE